MSSQPEILKRFKQMSPLLKKAVLLECRKVEARRKAIAKQDGNTLKFTAWELEQVRGYLTDAVRGALRRPGLDGEAVVALGAFLKMVERLPDYDEGNSASMTLSDDTGEGVGIWEAAFNSEGLELSTSEIFRSPYGSDHECRIVFKTSADWSSATDGLEDWLKDFAEMADSASLCCR